MNLTIIVSHRSSENNLKITHNKNLLSIDLPHSQRIHTGERKYPQKNRDIGILTKIVSYCLRIDT